MPLIRLDDPDDPRLAVYRHLKATNETRDLPLFVVEGQDRTTAELDAAAKDALSHRGQAIRALVPVLVEELRRVAAGEDRP